MYCPNCELRVETDVASTDDPDEAARYRQWFDESDVRGEHLLDDVGTEKTHEGTTYTVHLRVDICGNCAVPIDARTYLR